MSLELQPIENFCSALRRKFHDEFPQLALLIIIHRKGERLAALNNRKHELRLHPAGQIILPHLQKAAEMENDQSLFVGLARGIHSRHMGFVKEEGFLAAAFINVDDFAQDEDPAIICKHIAGAFLLEPLRVFIDYKNKDTHKNIQEQSGLLSRNLEPIARLRENMMADCFGAILLETAGDKNAITKVLKRRCEMSITPIQDYRPEDFPYPVAIDATKLVFRDLRDQAGKNVKPIAHMLHMLEEINVIYDDIIITKWVEFAQAAQEMAWVGHNRNEILSAAIYNSEDPYIRMSAYIIAEALNTDPVPMKGAEYYNPFIESAANERIHIRKCETRLAILLEKLSEGISEAENESDSADLFEKEARRQTMALMNGQLIGWCAPAIIEAGHVYRNSVEKTQAVEAATQEFNTILKETEWPIICAFHRCLIDLRRQGQFPTPPAAMEIIEAHPEFAFFRKPFEALLNLGAPQNKKAASQA